MSDTCKIPYYVSGIFLQYMGNGSLFGQIEGLYPVYNTNIRGIGIALKGRVQVLTEIVGHGSEDNENMHLPKLVELSLPNEPRGNTLLSGRASFAFVKTVEGPVEAGSIDVEYSTIESHPTGDGQPAPSGSYNPWRFKINSVSIVPLTCQTPQHVPVTMGPVPGSAFHGPGSKAQATSFNITLTNCPAGFNTIQYKLHPLTPIISQDQSVIAVTGGATGVGLQLLDAPDHPVPLDQLVSVPRYTPGSSTVDIPLQAAYYQTAPAITSGDANAAVEFSITYH
jgi:major type 1 subunit fimbrin (pilin)